MSNLNLKPYTLTLRDKGTNADDYDLYCANVKVKSMFVPKGISTDALAALLNAAYLKGVQDERAQRAAEYVRESFCMEDDDDDPPYIGNRPELPRDPRQEAIDLLIATYGFDHIIADRLVANGINCPAAFEGVEVEDLTGNCWFTRDEAEDIMSKVNPS